MPNGQCIFISSTVFSNFAAQFATYDILLSQMVKYFNLFAAALALMPISIKAQQIAPIDTIPLSLDQCITIALDQNPTIKVANMEIERVDYSKKETLSQLLPTVNFGGSYNRTLAKQVAYMNIGGFGGFGGSSSDEGNEGEKPASSGSGRQGIKMGLDNSYSVGFSASMPLIAPQLWASLKLSDSQILQTVETARQSKLQLINSVKNAYYSLLLAEDSRRVIQESYDNALVTHEIYQKKFSVGAASEYDVLRTSVAVKNVEPELAQADIAIKQARLQLTILLGMDSNHALTANSQLKEYEETMYEQALLNTDRSINSNSQLRLLELQTNTLRHGLEVQKASLYPTLSLAANYNWTSSNNGTPFSHLLWSPYSMIGVTLNVPIFTGGQRYYAIKQAQVQVNEMKWQKENLVRSLNMQVDLAIDNVNVNVKQIASNSESVSQAEKAHQIMERSFEIGAASYLDLRDSELALTRARLAYYQSIYNFLVANSDLELLLGKADIDKYSTPQQ